MSASGTARSAQTGPPGTSRPAAPDTTAQSGTSAAPFGVLFDVDGVVRPATLRRQWNRLRGLRSRSSHDRRSVLGTSGVLRALAAAHPDAPVFYVSGLPGRLARPVTGLLRRDGYPAGTLLMTGRTKGLRWLLTGNRAAKSAALRHATEVFPHRRWALVGDDGGPDPALYAGLAQACPGRVAAIALRQVVGPDPAADGLPEQVHGVPVVRAPNGEELLPRLRAVLGLPMPRGGAVENWMLTDAERGNEGTRLRAWTRGSAVRPLVHGRTYFPVLAATLDAAGAGDRVFFVGWRGDADERLTTAGATVGQALAGAARRGALVRGLLWRSHLSALQYSATENRNLALEVNAAGGQVLLDQRIRSRGSHHQKFVAMRRAEASADDVAFLGGIDLAHGRGDGGGHAGDPQTSPFADAYGPTPAWHDVQLQLHGPVVREVEEVFRERWEDPAALSRLPWHVLPDLVHRLPRTGSPLPPAIPDPPAAGTCTVQLLRSYPRRRPAYPFAPYGERSIARAYGKALSRAQRIVYIEDQYLWSFDVARLFAAALQRSPRLHLIAVVPRYPDQEGPVYTGAATLGHATALGMVHDAGGDRVQVFDLKNSSGWPVYVHSKVCVIDDVWAAVGSDNFNMRSWTHDSELTAAVLDEQRDDRAPSDPAGLGDGARRFARDLRLELMREHLGADDDSGLLDPDEAAEAMRAGATRLDAWYADGRQGPRPPGQLRAHVPSFSAGNVPSLHRWFGPAYRTVLDPDARPLDMKLRRTF